MVVPVAGGAGWGGGAELLRASLFWEALNHVSDLVTGSCLAEAVRDWLLICLTTFFLLVVELTANDELVRLCEEAVVLL
jgi:hypothetical protein